MSSRIIKEAYISVKISPPTFSSINAHGLMYSSHAADTRKAKWNYIKMNVIAITLICRWMSDKLIWRHLANDVTVLLLSCNEPRGAGPRCPPAARPPTALIIKRCILLEVPVGWCYCLVIEDISFLYVRWYL